MRKGFHTPRLQAIGEGMAQHGSRRQDGENRETHIDTIPVPETLRLEMRKPSSLETLYISRWFRPRKEIFGSCMVIRP